MGECLFNAQNPPYKAVQPGLFWYRLSDAAGVYSGVLCGLDADAFTTNQVTTHEHVMEGRVAQFTHYLKRAKLQAEPLLVIHENDRFAMDFEEKTTNRPADYAFRLGRERHELWRLSESQTKTFAQFAQRYGQFHLADGHHRLASSIKHLSTQPDHFPIQCFLLNKKMVKKKRFQWNVKRLLESSAFYATLNAIKQNDDQPDIVIATKEKVYTLACPKDRNPALYCFEDVLGFSVDAKLAINDYIDYIPLGNEEFSTINASDRSIASLAFRPLHWSEILATAKQGKRLPPKSTYLLPKLPTGLFIAPI